MAGVILPPPGSFSLERTFLSPSFLPPPQIVKGRRICRKKERGEPHPEASAAAPLTIPWAVLKQSGSGIRSRRRFNFSFRVERCGSFPRRPRKWPTIRITIPTENVTLIGRGSFPPLDEPSRFPLPACLVMTRNL